MNSFFTVYCASCRKKLGTVSELGWVWLAGTPCRLVNRRRLVTTMPGSEYESAPLAPPDDFRMRSVERRIGELNVYVWEYPYVCNADECTNSLGPEWEEHPLRDDSSVRWVLMPAGINVC